MDLVAAERQRLISIFERVGGDAPTLCEGWNSEDLLRHLVVREIVPHAQLLSKIPMKSAESARSQMSDVEAMDFAGLLDLFSSGRQKYSPLNLGSVDRAVNTLEYVIHHEDLRRAQDPPLGRVLSREEQGEVFAQLKAMAHLMFLKAPVKVVLRSPDFGDITPLPTKRHKDDVVVIGTPLELAMFSSGREADVDFEGSQDNIDKLMKSPRSM